VTPGFNPSHPFNVDDRNAVDALVTNVKEWLAKREIIKRLIAQNIKELNALREQLCQFEAHPGANPGATQQEIQRLKAWIGERENLETDMNDLIMGKRDSI
jgi:hypothetical protein